MILYTRDRHGVGYGSYPLGNGFCTGHGERG